MNSIRIFFVSHDRKEKITLNLTELQSEIDSGTCTEETLAWTKGLPNWLPLSDQYWEKYGISIDSCMPPEFPPLDVPDPKAAQEELKVMPSEKLDWKSNVAFHEGFPFTGIVVVFHENGQKKEEGSFKDGRKDGNGKSWYQSGKKRSEYSHKDGKLLKVKAWQPNGEPCPFTNLVNGNGTETQWHENGQKKSMVVFKDGKKGGVETCWGEDGTKEMEFDYNYGNQDEAYLTEFGEDNEGAFFRKGVVLFSDEALTECRVVGVHEKFDKDGNKVQLIQYYEEMGHYKVSDISVPIAMKGYLKGKIIRETEYKDDRIINQWEKGERVDVEPTGKKNTKNIDCVDNSISNSWGISPAKGIGCIVSLIIFIISFAIIFLFIGDNPSAGPYAITGIGAFVVGMLLIFSEIFSSNSNESSSSNAYRMASMNQRQQQLREMREMNDNMSDMM
jgi:antitoxin component YwqK of YwqJK toxin-antitoxin module